MEDWQGQLVEGFRVRERLGEGSIGVTYHAFHPSERIDAVIKVLADYLNQQEEVLKEFKRLASQLKPLKHPGIVRVIHHGDWRGQTYLVASFVAGPSLRKILDKKSGPLAWVDVFQIATQVSDALVYAHGKSVFHLGLRPGNVIVGRGGSQSDQPPQEAGYRAMLTDFGLRRLLEISFQQSSRPDHPLVLAYLSPEQCVASAVTSKTDVYSMGILLYEMVAGELPFKTPNVEQAVLMHMRTAPKRVGQHRIDVPRDVEELVMAMLAKQPHERPELQEVAQKLQAMRSSMGIKHGSSWEKFAAAAVAVRGATAARKPSPDVAPDVVPDVAAKRAPDRAADGPAELHISRRGEETRVVPLFDKKSVVAGRDSGCDIVLNDRRVSRRHCDIRWETNAAVVRDLGSNNGTFLGESKLIPHQPETLRPGTALHIPPYTLRLESLAPVVQPPVVEKREEKRPLGAVGEFASITLDQSQVQVTPGGAPAPVAASLQNLGRIVDWYRLAVSGIPHEWVSGTDAELQLNPRQQESTALMFHPPPEPTTTAGPHQVQVFVRSRERKSVVAKADMVLRVDPFSRFTLEVKPSQVESRTRADMQATILNKGNTLSEFTVQAADDAQALLFEIEPERFELPPAGSKVSRVSVAPRKPHWIGGSKLFPFTINTASSTADPQVLLAQYKQRSWLPMWLPILFLLLCCGILSVGAMVVPPLIPTLFPEPTTTATPTFTPIATSTVTPSPTPTYTPTPDVTATWTILDTDGDGLTNGEEIGKYDTNPLLPDTDGDGVSDGDEVDVYNSNPKDKDSDDDTWTDGEEVTRAKQRDPSGQIICPSPTNRDSDADGEVDSQDQSPCDLPTVTPSVTPTTTPVPNFAFGFHIAGNDNLDKARSAGATWIKKQIRFNPGDRAEALAQDLNEWHNQNFNVLLSVVGSKEHVGQGAAYYDQYAEYVGGLAAAGVDAIEIWNEPNIEREWPEGQINPSAFVQLVSRAAARIKANGPAVLVVTGALAPTGTHDGVKVWSDDKYLQGMVDAGLLNLVNTDLVDCVGVHHNAGATDPSERTGHPADDGRGHYSWYFLPQMEKYNEILGGAVPLCFTEMGYVSPDGYQALGQGFAWATDTSVQEHAQWVAKAVSLAYASGIVRLVIVWNLDITVYGEDDPQAGYAVIRPDDSCPACATLAGAIPR